MTFAGQGAVTTGRLGAGLALAFLLLHLGTAHAQQLPERGTALDAQRMVDRAIALYDREGLLAFRSISRRPVPDFLYRDLYVFVIDRVGYVAANALSARSVGFSAINARDSRGKYYVREMLQRASERGVWVDYMFIDPLLGHQAPKSTWVVYHDGYLFACGIYAGEISI